MDFKLVLSKLLSSLNDQKISYGLMGGFAMGLWGGSRSTVDLDFLVRRDDIPKIHEIMSALGYKLHYHSDNVSQYVSDLGVFGEVDFIHAFREASLEMLQRAEDKAIFGDTLRIKILRPEDIIGLKLQAIYNDPARERTDMADIESLAHILRGRLDIQLLRKYFTLFEMEDIFKAMFGEKQ